MRSVFCSWGIPPGSAVCTAWRRIKAIFEVAGANFFYEFDGVGAKCLFGVNWSQIRRADKIYCATIWQVIVVYIFSLGSNPEIIYWVQGLVAEENYLKRKSRLRYFVLLGLEKVAFVLASSYIFVSEFMRDFYFQRYPGVRSKKLLILPCVSDLSPTRDVLRRENSYCYLGGMSAWQKFDVVVRLMNTVVENNPGASFHVATRDLLVCKSILEEIGSPELLQVTSLTSLNGSLEISKFLSSVEFGFLIRDDNLVNNVSSPIKLAEYLSCGVSVISTDALRSYSNSIQKAGYIINPDVVLATSTIKQFEYKGEVPSLELHREFFSQSSVLSAVKRFLN